MTLNNTTTQNEPSNEEVKIILELFNANKLLESKKEINNKLIKYPKSSILFNILGAVLAGQNKPQEALLSYNNSIKINPNYFQAYNNLGACLYKLGEINSAIQNYKKAIKIEYNHPDAHNNLGSAYKELGEIEKSISSYEQAIKISPNHSDTYNNLGEIYRELGKIEKSIKNYEKAIEINPKHSAAYNNLGTVFKELKDYKKSVQCYKKAIETNPASSASYSNMGNSFRELGEYKKAIDCYHKAIKTNPNYADAYFNLGIVYKILNNLDESNKNFLLTIGIQPDHEEANNNLLFNTCWSNNNSEYLNFAKKFYKSINKINEKELVKIEIPKEKFIKIGFVSGDLRNHSVIYFLLDTLKYLKKKNVKLFAYNNNLNEDSLTENIKKYFDEWISIVNIKDKKLVNIIRKDKLDILFDLSGHTANNKLKIFKNRCAPVQVSWCGWLASTGIKEIDYIIGDIHATPLSNQNKFSEKIYQFKKIWQCSLVPNAGNGNPIIKKNNENQVTFGSFVNIIKVNDSVINIWSKILNQIPNSKLFLKCGSFDILEIKNKIIKKFENYKVNKKQLIIEGRSSRAEYFDCYNKIDIVLDTFPASGGTTSFDASYMGVPILTKVNQNSFWFKTGESINKNLKMHDWIAKDEIEYVKKAKEFSKDKNYLSNLKIKLKKIAIESPLFNSKDYSEEFYKMLLDIRKT